MSIARAQNYTQGKYCGGHKHQDGLPRLLDDKKAAHISELSLSMSTRASEESGMSIELKMSGHGVN